MSFGNIGKFDNLRYSSFSTTLALHASEDVIRTPQKPVQLVPKRIASPPDTWVGPPIGPPTFRELFTKMFNDVIDFIVLLHSVKELCSEDDWAIAGAMETDLLGYINPESVKRVMMIVDDVGNTCTEGTLGFHVWQDVGRKILARVMAQGFVVTHITSLGKKELKNAVKEKWFNVYYAFGSQRDAIGVWETCYVIRTPGVFPIGHPMLVPPPRRRPAAWAKSLVAPGTELPCRSIPVHPALIGPFENT